MCAALGLVLTPHPIPDFRSSSLLQVYILPNCGQKKPGMDSPVGLETLWDLKISAMGFNETWYEVTRLETLLGPYKSWRVS